MVQLRHRIAYRIAIMRYHPEPLAPSPEPRSRPMQLRYWFVGLAIVMIIWGIADVRLRGYPWPERPEEHKTDLTVYTEAGAAFFDGRPPYEVTNLRGWSYLYPPLFAMVLAPLHVLPLQDQVFVWYLISLWMCWGCYRECVRLLNILRNDDGELKARCAAWFPRLGFLTLVAVILPALNCLQRGQVGVLKLYLLLLGARLILGGRTYRAWLGGGIVLAMPVVLKLMPILPVAILLLVQLVAVWRKSRLSGGTSCALEPSCLQQVLPSGKQLAFATAGVTLGLGLFFFLVPACLIGWNANLRHLHTWTDFVVAKADDGGVEVRSGNSHVLRNQSLSNAVYRLGHFTAHVLAAGPDDRLANMDDGTQVLTDSTAVHSLLLMARISVLLALLLAAVRLGRVGTRLSQMTGIGLACVAMLVISPVARGHYFVLLAPAILFLPLWLDLHGMRRAAIVMGIAPALLTVPFYAMMDVFGRIGLLGLGTTFWLVAAVVLVDRASRRHAERQITNHQGDSSTALRSLLEKAA
jgi:hypothetical protein